MESRSRLGNIDERNKRVSSVATNSMQVRQALHKIEPNLPLNRKARDVKLYKLLFRAPLPTWHKSRLVIIGDAAHPMLPCESPLAHFLIWNVTCLPLTRQSKARPGLKQSRMEQLSVWYFPKLPPQTPHQ